MAVVEQYARAHIVTDAVIPDDETIPVVLRYDPDTDPRSVRVGLPGTHEWTFSRSLLEQGLRAPAGSGEVRVWPCGRVQAVVEFHSAQGVSVVQFETKSLLRFLRRTYMAAAPVTR
ncbi:MULTISPECIES: SsgA family sporulation/cell division regulator [unclassified Streptomyces]|uniref:SsgA family sporulation/cell division regulator n=1 Tax=unclassified Streptomyces TaxID=2593676 RepID=UPI0022548446|nr:MULTISPECIES: SsgA family sporulation/cell division regulator [unclassified Streptomyces]MCX5048769.1 SsgA family sporulation/cell division regulator [Streptomyces sp. NBC_00474]MCX5056490.1 SsgA family sporulation/cell division regulator [Streptomyces sp. NBC_00452]MCX5246589.1 SsgA family sporulation/cell division regulator [Streptomyces sp. NBC_00201]MCX5287591.1 SsgA family sporulation/cell division regulator [Streptomyces sp. NBC_00183]